MQISSTRPNITVAGITLAATAPYVAGHALLENEAAVLNQTLAENLRNNFAKTVADKVEAATKAGTSVDVAALQAEFDAYISGYAFGVRKAGTPRVVDPIERMSLSIATDLVKEALRKKGLKLGDGEGQVGKTQLQSLVTAMAAKDAVRKEAKRRVEASAKIDLTDLGLGG